MLEYIPFWGALYYCIYAAVDRQHGCNISCTNASNHIKNKMFAADVISMLNSYWYLLYQNQEAIIAYYIYDLGRMVLNFSKKDIALVLHHVVTIYMVSLPVDSLDGEKVAQAMKYVKFGDLFFYWYDIVKHSNLSKSYPKLALNIQIVSVIMSIVFWSYYRIWCTLKFYPLYSVLHNAIGIVLHVATAYWVWGMFGRAKRLF